MAGARPQPSDTIRSCHKQALTSKMQRFSFYCLILFFVAIPVLGQEYRITKPLPAGTVVEIRDLSGRVSARVAAESIGNTDSDAVKVATRGEITLIATSERGVSESEVKFTTGVRT